VARDESTMSRCCRGCPLLPVIVSPVAGYRRSGGAPAADVPDGPTVTGPEGPGGRRGPGAGGGLLVVGRVAAVTESMPGSRPGARERAAPSASWLADRYLVDLLTSEQIAVMCGWSAQYVRDRLREHGIPLRRPGTHAGLQAVDRDTLDGWLRRGLSVDDIAGRSGHGVTGVSQLLRRFDLTPPRAAIPP